jgi:hypothetical protein
MAFTSSHTGAPAPSLAAELLTLIVSPTRAFPHLFERDSTTEVTFFAATSGVYVAYVAAERLHVGDYFPLPLILANTLLIGIALGIFALYVTGGLLAWSAERLRGDSDPEHMWSVFGYATWPFLPLLCILLPLEFSLYGSAVFSSNRPPVPAFVPVLTTALELGTIITWLVLMVRGTALAASLTNARAAEALALSFLETLVISALFLVILAVSFMI